MTSLPPFPDSERVVYGSNPLIEVICQLRFPPILRIAAESPVAFQERIRTEYPLLVEKSPEVNIEMPPGVPDSIAALLKGTLPKRKLIGYDFTSADERWKVSLTRDFLSLSTSDYRHWEGFHQHLQGPFQALIAIYSPAFFTRVGLRYQDLIQRSRLKLSQLRWSDLIKPHLAGVHAVPELDGSVKESLGQLLISLPQFKGSVRINYGVVQPVGSTEDCFLIDSDYYTEERTKYDAVDGTLSYFNKQSGRLFRWSIEPRLHQAMDPQPV